VGMFADHPLRHVEELRLTLVERAEINFAAALTAMFATDARVETLHGCSADWGTCDRLDCGHQWHDQSIVGIHFACG